MYLKRKLCTTNKWYRHGCGITNFNEILFVGDIRLKNNILMTDSSCQAETVVAKVKPFPALTLLSLMVAVRICPGHIKIYFMADPWNKSWFSQYGGNMLGCTSKTIITKNKIVANVPQEPRKKLYTISIFF